MGTLNDDFKTETRGDIAELRSDVKGLLAKQGAIWWIGVAIGVVVGLCAHTVARLIGL